MNDDFYEDSFEICNIFLGQKLTILEFLPKISFILTSVTSETSRGQTMSFSDLTVYEVLFIDLGKKLKHSETAISHWALLDHPRILNWPKSPHRLGLKFEKKYVYGLEI